MARFGKRALISPCLFFSLLLLKSILGLISIGYFDILPAALWKNHKLRKNASHFSISMKTRAQFKTIARETTIWEQMELPFGKKTKKTKNKYSFIYNLGFYLLAIALGGIIGPLTPVVRLESSYYVGQAQAAVAEKEPELLPPSVPIVTNPLLAPDGSTIVPVTTDFAIVIPKIGVNASVVPSVNPTNTHEYEEALQEGVAHSSFSYFPDENGTVYLFSHSTNYDWFVKDLNAVFYLLKNLDVGDEIVLVYKSTLYTYSVREKQIVNPTDISYLTSTEGIRSLTLQTCWPPGQTTERLLLFADLISEQSM